MTVCRYSYFLPIVVLIAGVIFVDARDAAWRHRKPGVTWFDGPGDIAIFRSRLFTEEGNRLRRRAVFWYIMTLVLMAATFIIASTLCKIRSASA